MSAVRVVGVDPGPVPGIVRLHVEDGRLVERWSHAVQCSWPVAAEIVAMFTEPDPRWSCLVQVERFVIGRGSGKTGRDGAVARDLVGVLQQVAEDRGATFTQQTPARVKHWATDQRLAAARLLEPTKGMRHARDAARHALFAAVTSGALTDPLSKQTNHRGAHR